MIKINKNRWLLTTGLLLVFVGLTPGSIPVRDFLGDQLGFIPTEMFSHQVILAGFNELRNRPRMSVGLGLKFASEQRLRPAYDQFENTIGEAVIADNISFNWIPGPVSFVYPMSRFWVKLAVAPARDFHYDYRKELRDDFYEKIGEDRLVQRGNLSAVNFDLAFKPFSFFAFGLGFRYAYGGRELESKTIRGMDTITFISRSNLKSPAWSIGVAVLPFSRFSVGLDYQSRISFSGQDSFGVKGYPWSGQIILDYQAAGELPSLVRVIAGMEGWAEVDHGLHNVIFLKSWVEHIMLNFVRLRYGFGLSPLCSDPSVHRIDALLGLGFTAGRYRLNLDGNLCREVLSASDFALPVVPEDIRVDETKLILKTGVEYEF
ncbi:MAG: hypothetical protein ACUVUD_05550 [bacterium]